MENSYTEFDKEAIKKEILNIFLEIKKIIVKYNLRYFAIGGTCLGAVRHKGFIPWDDDMDIAMPEKDYEKFLRIAPNELPSHLKLRTPNKCRFNRLLFSKVYDQNTACIEESDLKYPNLYKGVYVDIMPLCGIPSNYRLYLKKIQLLETLNNCSRRIWDTLKGIKKMLNLFLYYFCCLVGNDFFYKKWYRYVTKFKFDQSAITGYVWSNNIWRTNKRIFPKEWFDGYVELPFENTTIRCPIGWHEYLTKHFGNYMEIPSEDNRTSGHHMAIVDLEHPYSYYIDLINKGEIKI